jgi:glycerophosphoryl diester phosphodiesterase
VAHRGGAGLAPENTLAAFVEAVEVWGAEMLELDVRLSADGHVMVIHDATVDRTTDGSGAVAEMTRSELQALDAGARFVDPEGRRSRAGTGVVIPTLDELLERLPYTRMNVEAKCREVAGPLADLVVDRGAQDRVLIAAEHERNREPARGYPGPWGASRSQLLPFWLLHATPLSWLYTPGVDALQVPPSHRGRQVVTRRFVAEAHRRNIAVHVWTIDDPAQMRRLLALGVDAIQTDRPDVLAQVLHEFTGRPLPPGLKGGGTRVDTSARDATGPRQPGTGPASAGSGPPAPLPPRGDAGAGPTPPDGTLAP